MPLPLFRLRPPLRRQRPRETGEREERVRMSSLRQTICPTPQGTPRYGGDADEPIYEGNMSENHGDPGEIQRNLLKKHGVKLGFMSFFVKAVFRRCKKKCRDRPMPKLMARNIIRTRISTTSALRLGPIGARVSAVLRDWRTPCLSVGLRGPVGERRREKRRDGSSLWDDMPRREHSPSQMVVLWLVDELADPESSAAVRQFIGNGTTIQKRPLLSLRLAEYGDEPMVSSPDDVSRRSAMITYR